MQNNTVVDVNYVTSQLQGKYIPFTFDIPSVAVPGFVIITAASESINF